MESAAQEPSGASPLQGLHLTDEETEAQKGEVSLTVNNGSDSQSKALHLKCDFNTEYYMPMFGSSFFLINFYWSCFY